MTIRISITKKGLQLAAIEKWVTASLQPKYPEARIAVTRIVLPETRADRFAAAIDLIGQGKGILEELRDELQDWLNNLPENLAAGTKADALQEAIDGLEQMIDACDDVENGTVEFPGMY